jgi:hypothetical protein
MKIEKTRLTFLPFSDSNQFGDSDGFVEMAFNSKQEAFDYMCFYASEIDFATIQVWGQPFADSYNCEKGFLKELVKKQKRRFEK